LLYFTEYFTEIANFLAEKLKFYLIDCNGCADDFKDTTYRGISVFASNGD